MWKILLEFISDAFLNCQDWIAGLGMNKLGGLVLSSLCLEKGSYSVPELLSENAVEKAYWAVYGIAFTLLLLKLLWKGFKVYILERDGDADASPFHLLAGSGMALGCAAAFPVLYPILVDAVLYIGEKIVEAFQSAIVTPGMEDIVYDLGTGTWGWLRELLEIGGAYVVGGLAYLILYAILYFKLLVRGVELLVFRLGIPFAAMDLVNSDGGMWKNYIQILFRQAALSLTQIVLLTLGMMCIALLGSSGSSLIIGISFAVAALGAPKLMAQIFPPVSGGSGFVQKAYVVGSVARLFVKA